jgi:hypothetical protein
MSKRNENLKRKVASYNRAQNKATHNPIGQASILALELKSLKREMEELELILRTSRRENEELELANARLKENINSISKQIDNLYSELEKHESRANMSIIRRTLSWPIFQYTRLRDREIRSRDKALTVQSEEISGLKKKINNQRIHIKGLSEKLSLTKESESRWKSRHNQISKERREEKGLSENSLIDHLREINLQKDKKIAELENTVLSQPKDEIDPNIPTSVSQALEMARIKHDIIELVGNALKSARNSPYAHPSKVLDALTEMAESAIEWNQNPEGSGPYENILNGLDVADGDSKDRFVTDGDSSLRMNRHVKLGVTRDPSKTLRIYYDIERGGKLKIGWCGEHPS